VPLEYQRWQRDGVNAADLTPANGCFRLARRVWRRLPATAVEYLGAWASRHIPG
jgi:hypothetical protein